MITIGFSTREVSPDFIEHIKSTCGPKNIEIIPFENKGTHSLSEAYNIILEKSSNDIVILCHDDIYFDKKGWGNKIVKHFNKNPDYGILGLAGSISMPDTGRWWDDNTKMKGIVNHEHEGKKWESKYSNSLGNKVEEVLLVDGLFIAINKNNIVHTFDESVNGFHFYDIYFSFKNHLSGVKIGVMYDVRVTHLSIGQTNDEWEKNRILFTERFKSDLPKKLPELFENKKLKVLLGVLNFQGLTGSEISTIELAKGLSKKGCDVSVISFNVSSHFKQVCNNHGIKTYLMSEPPGYKVGDGLWSMKTPNGLKTSEKGKLYRLKNVNFDIIQTNHTPITERLLELYPEKKFVTIVRSEIIDLENPVVNDNVKGYIAIRPSIKDYLISDFDLDSDSIEVIYNPFDDTRFKPKTKQEISKKITLFVGTMDYLRKSSIEDLITSLDKSKEELWLVGKDTMGYASKYGEMYDHVNYYPPTEKIEDFYHQCDVTAGIMLGRTTIEGYLCGKPGIIYNVDKEGNIKGKEFTEVPLDIEKFNRDTIINNFKNFYIKKINE